MKEWAPILFPPEMVRADREGRKTEARKIVIKQPCPYAPGTKLWIWETWSVHKGYDDLLPTELDFLNPLDVWYTADGPKPEWCGKTRLGIFLPRWLSRTMRVVDDIRVERLQSITPDGCEREGVIIDYDYPLIGPCNGDIQLRASEKFSELWDSMYESRGFGWNTNPWVWVVKYRRE